MNSTCALSLYTVNPSIITTNSIHRKSNISTSFFGTHHQLKSSHESPVCRANSSSSITTEFDLYELLGIDNSCNQAQIKLAYRALQKKCHPDIAGPAGHDMAIILNEAYAVLSDPNSRLLYDKEQSKVADLRGYTGKPIYSVWLGSESEKRAVFVDEVKCVGCLKCALLAEKTFAVESVYGRARVVAQWADPEHQIQSAIGACPVDCISVVERSNLAALEFLMSKQPRGRVRIGTGNTVGARSSNVFDELDKFQARYQASSSKNSKESDVQTDARASAIQAIKAISNWLYWHAPPPTTYASSAQYNQDLTVSFTHKSNDPTIKKLKNAAAARKQARNNNTIHFLPRISSNPSSLDDEYWAPSDHLVPHSNQIKNNSESETTAASPESSPTTPETAQEISISNEINTIESNPLLRFVPVGLATVAAAVVRLQLGEGETGIGLKDHVAGSLIRDIVNSSWLQVILAGVTWYLIGMYVLELVVVVQSKLGKDRK